MSLVTEPQIIEETPVLIVSGYRGSKYNIARLGNKYYAIHQQDGAFDIVKIKKRKYSKEIFCGDSLEETASKLSGVVPEDPPTGTTDAELLQVKDFVFEPLSFHTPY
jgi:hypothetical protein